MDRLTKKRTIERIRAANWIEVNGARTIVNPYIPALCDLALSALDREADAGLFAAGRTLGFVMGLEEAAKVAEGRIPGWNASAEANDEALKIADAIRALKREPNKVVQAHAEEQGNLRPGHFEREPNAAAQVPHGVCRADDPNREATPLPDGSVSLSHKAVATAATPETSERGETVSVSDDRSGTRIPAPAAPDVASMVKRLNRMAEGAKFEGGEHDASTIREAANLLAKLGQGWIPEPVAWRREWDGDVSDIGAMLYASSQDELDEPLSRWQPLYAREPGASDE